MLIGLLSLRSAFRALMIRMLEIAHVLGKDREVDMKGLDGSIGTHPALIQT